MPKTSPEPRRPWRCTFSVRAGKIAAVPGVLKLELLLRLIRTMSENHETRNREEQVVNLLHTAARHERAPESLRAEVTAMRSGQGTFAAGPTIRRPVLGAVGFGMPAVAAAVVALVVALGGAGAPSLAQAAALAVRGPSPAPVPALEPGAPSYLTARVGGLHFPNWESQGGWRTVGVRHDKIGNRDVTTVYYSASGKRIAYSIVSAPALGGCIPPVSPTRRSGTAVASWSPGKSTTTPGCSPPPASPPPGSGPSPQPPRTRRSEAPGRVGPAITCGTVAPPRR